MKNILIIIAAAVVAAIAIGTHNNYVHADAVAANATMLEPAGD
jgi:hypothetical protein